uniref:RING-type domain-containing protein n=1 Tax=Meloidogyne enterolobii TaxID=390850 RepID=A0A6V7V624_MELEN|nr:unnamed protein product [Meloidogyne enterolobii]
MWIDGSLERKRVDLIVGKLNPIIEEIETNAMNEFGDITLNEALNSGQEICPICQLSYEEGDKLEMTKCADETDPNKYYNHFYHHRCINNWINRGQGENRDKCPTCLRKLEIMMHPKAVEINEKLNKIGMGFDLETMNTTV